MKPKHSMFLSSAMYGVMHNFYREIGKGDEDAPVVRGIEATPKVGCIGLVRVPSAINVSPSLRPKPDISSAIGDLGVLKDLRNSSSSVSSILLNQITLLPCIDPLVYLQDSPLTASFVSSINLRATAKT